MLTNLDLAYVEGFIKHCADKGVDPELFLEDLVKNAQRLDNVKELAPLNERELERAVRDAAIAEQDAIKQYETVADSTDNVHAKKVLQAIANEEKAHTGELSKLLEELNPDNEKQVESGKKEAQAEDVPQKDDTPKKHWWNFKGKLSDITQSKPFIAADTVMDAVSAIARARIPE